MTSSSVKINHNRENNYFELIFVKGKYEITTPKQYYEVQDKKVIFNIEPCSYLGFTALSEFGYTYETLPQFCQIICDHLQNDIDN